MSSIQILVTTGTKTGVVGIMDGDLIKQHSATVRNIVDSQQPSLVYQVQFTNVAPPAIDWILKKIKANKPNKALYLKVHDLPLIQAICIEEAVRRMRIEPAQPHIEGHILGYVSHNIVTPSEMVTIHKAYHNISGSRIHKALIHHLSYNMIGGSIDSMLNDELFEAAQPFPALVTAVEVKLKELKDRQAQMKRYRSLKVEEKEKPLKGKAWRKQKNEFEDRKEDEKAQRDWEEAQGFKELSEENARKIMGRW